MVWLTWLRKNDTFDVQPSDCGQPQIVSMPQQEGRVLDVISATPEMSTRSIVTHERVSETSVVSPAHTVPVSLPSISSTRTYATWLPTEKNLLRGVLRTCTGNHGF
jgi:hypothetical protein